MRPPALADRADFPPLLAGKALRALLVALMLAGASAPAIGRDQASPAGPIDLTAQTHPESAPKPVPAKAPAAPTPPPPAPPTPLPQTDLVPPVAKWTVADARDLYTAIRASTADGLFPRDYQPAALQALIQHGPSEELNTLASKLFVWLAEDLRDGRTPFAAREQWFVVDPDQDLMPNSVLLAEATENHDVKGVLNGLLPTHPDYAALKDMLAKAKDPRQIAMIRANLDRWRWLPRELGLQYLIINVPEMMLRLTVNNHIITSYRAIVGKPGDTATPQLSADVKNVVFNPTWTVPQSIVVKDNMGVDLTDHPAKARREGFVVTHNSDDTYTVVQQPGEKNALGRVKLDMPNEHAIYIHDTPSRGLFALSNRALSHGCVRAERATELAMTMAILGTDLAKDTAVQYAVSGKYTKVPMQKPWSVYITYFTVARDVNGLMRSFTDIYHRDGAVLASLAHPRELHTSQRKSAERVIQLDNPL